MGRMKKRPWPKWPRNFPAEGARFRGGAGPALPAVGGLGFAHSGTGAYVGNAVAPPAPSCADADLRASTLPVEICPRFRASTLPVEIWTSSFSVGAVCSPVPPRVVLLPTCGTGRSPAAAWHLRQAHSPSGAAAAADPRRAGWPRCLPRLPRVVFPDRQVPGAQQPPLPSPSAAGCNFHCCLLHSLH